MILYFECNSGISGDMAVAALLDLGASREKLETALASMKLENEFSYNISKMPVNSVMATDFDVILPRPEYHPEHHHEHHHEHRNLFDVNKIIDGADASNSAKALAKRIFQIVAEAEAKVHGKSIEDVHFHEVGAIDSIVDIVGFSVLYDDLSPEYACFSPLTEGRGTVMCQHGELSVPVPAVLEIVSKYKLPMKLTENEGEMVTPTGAAIAAALYEGKTLPETLIIEKTGCGRGKRPYKNPILRIMEIKEK